MGDPRKAGPTLDATVAGFPGTPTLAGVPAAAQHGETAAHPGVGGFTDAANAPAPPGEHYEVRGEIARGGMGAILRVWDRTLQRELAIKTLRADVANHPDVLRRFVEEARISGQLQHPGVVPIHEFGHLPDGRLFFAMKLVQGRTLEELLLDRADPTTDLPRFLKVFEQICETLAFAHSRGIIHRDLKPLNVMVGAYGEVQVMDWGLAKSLNGAPGNSAATAAAPEISTAASGETVLYANARLPESAPDADWHTQAGSVLGTPSYMPPEQARGENDELDERADVFGLGAILCCILTGKPPFGGPSLAETLRQSAAGAVGDAFTRLDSSGADHELIALARSCLAPDRANRPRTARAVSEVMTRYLNGVQERLRKAEIDRARFEAERKRRRVQLALAAVVALALTLGGAAWFFVQKQADKRRSDTDHAADVALMKAQQLRDRAAAMPNDSVAQAEAALAIWQQSLAAVEQAETATATADASPAAVERVRQTRTEIAAGVAQAERAIEESRRAAGLAAAIAESRQESARDNNIEDSRAAAAQMLDRAFKEYGIDVLGGTVESAATALGQTRPALRQPVTQALNDWQTWDRKHAELLRQISDRFDPDPWMKKYRAAYRTGPAAWKQLAEAEPLKNLTAGQLDLLADACLWGYDRSYGLALYREAVGLHPNDFYLNYHLATLLCPAYAQVPANRPEALAYYRAATAAEPRSLWPRMHFADVLNREGQAEAALYEARACTDIDPRFAPGWATQARQLYRLGRYDEALPPARKMLASKFGDWRMYTRILPTFEHFHLTAEIEETANLMWKYGSAGRLLAIKIRRGDDRAVRELLDELLHTKSADAGALRDAAQYFLYHSPDLDRAVAGFRRCNEVSPQWLYEYQWLSIALERKGDKAEAAKVAARAAQLGLRLSDFHAANLDTLCYWGYRAEALAEFRTILALPAAEPHVYSEAARVWREHGEFDLALQAARQGVRTHAEHPWSACELVATLIQLRDYKAAEEAVHALGVSHPHCPQAVSELARVQWERDDYDAVIRTAQPALSFDQRTSMAAPWLGLALREKGDLDGALRACRQAVEIDPKSSRAHAVLSFVQADRGALGEALVSAERALVMDVFENPTALANDPFAHAAMGWVYLKKGETDKALATMRHALKINAEPVDGGPVVNSPNMPRWLASQLVRYAGSKPEHSALRGQALEWLRADLDLWRTRSGKTPALFRSGLSAGIAAARADRGLAGVRDLQQLAQLPADERAAWEQFWRDLAAARKKLGPEAIGNKPASLAL